MLQPNNFVTHMNFGIIFYIIPNYDKCNNESTTKNHFAQYS